MVFNVNHEIWLLISSCYEKGAEKLPPTTKILIKNLMASLKMNRTITSSYEANLLITLLLSCAKRANEITDDENCRHEKDLNKDAWHEESTTWLIRINQVIEQLRLFSKSIEAYEKDCFRERSR